MGPAADRVCSALILTSLLATLLAFANVALTFQALVAIFCGWIVIILAGECILCLARIDQIAAKPLVAVVLGSISTSMALVAAVFAWGHTAGAAFLVWSVLVVAAALALRQRLTVCTHAAAMDLLAMAACAAIVAIGCMTIAGAVPTLEATAVLPAWTDYYIHGSVVANFGSPIAAGRGDIMMSGSPVTFYHYGYYQLAAALMGAVDATGLTISTAILLPVGLFLAAIAAYALASELADRRAGVLAIALLVLLPDTSRYGLENGFFGFHWLNFTHPGAGYGLACCAAASAILLSWLRTGNRRALLLAALLVAALIQLRAHFFVCFAPAFLGTVILSTPLARRHTGTLWAAGVLLLVTLFTSLAVITPLREFWLAHSAVAGYLNEVHEWQEPTAYAGLYTYLLQELGQVAAIFAGTALLILAVLGVFAVAYPAALIYTVRSRGWSPSDALPLLLLVMLVIVTLLAPGTAFGDVTEYQHRPADLLYMVVVIWTAAYAVRALPSTDEHPVWTGSAVVGVAAVTVLLVVATGIDPAAPRFGWGKDLYNVAINPDIARAAREIRRNAQAGDIVAIGPVDIDKALVDVATEITSLTDVPTFLARYKNQILGGEGALGTETMRQDAKRRLALQQEIEASTDPNDVMRRLRENDITWYVWTGKDAPRFDPDRRNATFRGTGIAVYRVGRVPRP